MALIAVACTNASESDRSPVTESPSESRVLKIWWDKGFTMEEDEALQQLVSDWEQQTGNKIKLSFYTTNKLPQKVQRVLQSGNTPDIMMSNYADRLLSPHLAWEGKLADVSDVIEPVKSLYPHSVLKTVHFYNNADQKWSYYAVPIHQAAIQIFYWRDLIEQVGRTESEIPTA